MEVLVRRASGSIVFDTGLGLKVTVRGGLGRGSFDCGCCGLEDDDELIRGELSETALAILCCSRRPVSRELTRWLSRRCYRTRADAKLDMYKGSK